jgi:hypothetical protein
MSRSSWPSAPRVGAAAAAADATPATSRAGRKRDRLALQASSKLTERPTFNLFFKPVPRDAAVAAAAARRLADLCALRDEQRAKEAELVAKEAAHQQVANAQGQAAAADAADAPRAVAS